MTIDDFEVFLDSMTPEQLTLYLARLGIMPNDVQAGLDRAQKLVRDFAATQSRSDERDWYEFTLDSSMARRP